MRNLKMTKLVRKQKGKRLEHLLHVDDPVFDNVSGKEYIVFSNTDGVQVLTDKGPVSLASWSQARAFAYNHQNLYFISYLDYKITPLIRYINDRFPVTIRNMTPNKMIAYKDEIFVAGERDKGA